MIELQCIGHDFAFELNNIAHLFEPYLTEIVCIKSERDGNCLQTTLYRDTQCLDQETTILSSEVEDKKKIKLELKKMLYTVLSRVTNQSMPWGTLTGIRPTKIVHEYWHEGLDEEQIKSKLVHDYKISQEKTNLMYRVAEEEEKILTKNKPSEVSLYIGIPFCPTRCVYCSFTAYSIEGKAKYVTPYLEALFKEIAFVSKQYKETPIRSLYIGGGTPTSLSDEDFERLLQWIAQQFDLAKIEEYTVEAGRPDTITRAKLIAMKKYGVGRISINPQSMNQKTLDTIGRHHTVEAIKEVFAMARELGHENINMDIILGLPNETISDVCHTLNELKALAPENITVHTLAIKRASRIQTEHIEYQLAEMDKIQAMLLACETLTKEMGLIPYYMYRQKNMLGNFENVGYAKPGSECIYNVEIMAEKEPIIAMGAGAVTKIVYQNGERIDRIPNVKSLEDYINRIDEMIERKRTSFMKYK